MNKTSFPFFAPLTRKGISAIAFLLAMVLPLTLTLSACSSSDDDLTADLVEEKEEEEEEEETTTTWTTVVASPDEWDGEKRADITYQLLVYSFADSDGDGYGDLAGVTSKLDYINSLGVSAIWLSPIHPSMSYHGYDVTDYTEVNPDLGTMSDFETLVAEANSRNIKIYLDYVMNHTGTDHPWFQAALEDEESEYRDYYIFSTDPASDIAAGKIDMIASEGSSGYDSGEWFSTAGSSDAMEGIYTFTLDWSDSSKPTVTVTEGTAADADNPDTSTDGAKYLYYGDAVCKKFYDKGNDIYELTVDYSSSWGFLIRTSNTTWDGGTKYGASSSSDRIELGTAFTLDNSTAADIIFATMDLYYFHSCFQTDWFADLNYGPATDCASSPAYQALLEAAQGWVDRGVDGLRLDAVKHIYHSATSSENPTFLKTFYDDMDAYYKSQGHTDDFYMVGEVLSEYNEVAPYYAGLPALFEFSFWYRLEYAINYSVGRYFAKDILGYQETYANYRSDYIEATKLSNHDENRAASELGKSLAKEKLAACVLLTSGGSPYIYYGEELGLYGTQTNGDEYVRGPMLWGDNTVTSYTTSIDSSVASTIASVPDQQADESSLLNVYTAFTQLRNTEPALAKGQMVRHGTYNEDNETYAAIGAWYMVYDTTTLLVVHNFSASSVEMPITDNIGTALGVNGDVQLKVETTGSTSSTSLVMGAYSSVVYRIGS